MFIDPSGCVVTEWDKNHLTNDELQRLQELTEVWIDGNKTGNKNKMLEAQSEAARIRNKYLSENEILLSDGNVIIAVANSTKNNSFSLVLSPYGSPNTTVTEGSTTRRYGSDGRAVNDVHNTDYGNPKHHANPHGHDWDWSNPDHPRPGPSYPIPPDNSLETNKTLEIVSNGFICVGMGYLIYRGIRIIPSLIPALWWTIPVNLVTP